MHARHHVKADLHHSDSITLAAGMRTSEPRYSFGSGAVFGTTALSLRTQRGGGHGLGFGRAKGKISPRLTLSGSGKARRLKRRYPVLLLLATLMMLCVFAPATHHILTGIHKVIIRGLLFSIDRPEKCLPSTPAPSNLADDDPIVGLSAADLTDLPGEIPSDRSQKIGIISLCDHNMEGICAASIANKQAYADKHGYDVILDGSIIDETRPTSWSKLLAMR